MNVIIPLTMTKDYLLGCNIPENEQTEWADGGFNSLGTTNRNWQAICRSSSDTLWACVYGGDIYYSTDSGLTWTAYGAGSKDWNGITARGTNIYASVYNGSIWKLTGETGSFTDLSQTTRNWGPMCVCTDNHVWCLIVATNVVYIYKQTDGTGDFANDQTVNNGTAMYGLCTAPNGNQYVSLKNGSNYYIFRRASNSGAFADLGATVWPTARPGGGLCANSSGDIYCAAQNDSVYVRTAGAGNFNTLSTDSLAWRGICVDGNDSVFACVYAGSLYKADGFQTYNTDDYCQVTTGELSEHKIYQSNTDSNTGNDPETDTTNWSLVSNTNRTKVFDNSITSQALATNIPLTYCFMPKYNYVITDPALTINYEVDSISVLNLNAATLDIIEIDLHDDLFSIGMSWTGATGTTQPTGTDLVGDPSDFLLIATDYSYYALQVTTDAASEGFSKTMTVSAATEYQLLMICKYPATGIKAQFKIEDVTHSTTILDTTDITNGNYYTDYFPTSYVFTTPAGCTSVKISFINSIAGVVTWKYVFFAPTVYSETITAGSLVKTICKTDLLQGTNETIYTVKATASHENVYVGKIILGRKYEISPRAPNFGVSWGIKDWSTIDADTFGNYVITPRETSKWMKMTLEIEDDYFDAVSNFLTAYHSTMLMYVGSETNQSMMIYGFADDWSFTQDETSFGNLSLSIAGLT